VRLFVAVRPPDDILDAVAALPRPTHPGVRWTARDQWHVTLRFLGEVEDPTPVAAALAAAPLDSAPAGPVDPSDSEPGGQAESVGPLAPEGGGRVGSVGPVGSEASGRGPLVGGAGPEAGGPVAPEATGRAGSAGGVVAVVGPRVTALGPRVVCLPIAGLDDLAAAVTAATAGWGLPPEARRFRGHLTLARVGRGGGRARDLAGAALAARFRVADVRLVRSHLGGPGARYEDLLVRPLPKA
jgi:2'-5' RNA ligase